MLIISQGCLYTPSSALGALLGLGHPLEFMEFNPPVHPHLIPWVEITWRSRIAGDVSAGQQELWEVVWDGWRPFVCWPLSSVPRQGQDGEERTEEQAGAASPHGKHGQSSPGGFHSLLGKALPSELLEMESWNALGGKGP